MNKSELRDKYIDIRKRIIQTDKNKYDNDIFNKVISLNEYNKSKLILIYVSLKDEIDTFKLIEYSLKHEKDVAVPKCEGDSIEFYYIRSLKDLEKGKYNILEPKTEKKVINFSNSICIIPGIAFDIDRNRVGYGKGYYDRFLYGYSGVKIGISYNNCICEKIDIDDNDIKMDIVITN